MALQTNSKNQIVPVFPGLGSGKYFLFFAFVFLFSCTILSLRLEDLWVWSIGISVGMLFFSVFLKNKFFAFAILLPILAGILIQADLRSMDQQRQSILRDFLVSTEISGTIVDL